MEERWIPTLLIGISYLIGRPCVNFRLAPCDWVSWPGSNLSTLLNSRLVTFESNHATCAGNSCYELSARRGIVICTLTCSSAQNGTVHCISSKQFPSGIHNWVSNSWSSCGHCSQLSRNSLQSFSSIVAVHGLGGDLIPTWTHPKSNAFWLKDFLPQQIPDARIMTFGYNASATFGESMSDVIDHAKSLLSSLVDKREESEVHIG